MEREMTEVALADGSLRVGDGAWEYHLRLDDIDERGLRCEVWKMQVMDGQRAYYDRRAHSYGAAARAERWYVVADAEEIRRGCDVSWMGRTVLKSIEGEPVVLTKLARAEETYGGDAGASGLFDEIAGLYRCMVAAGAAALAGVPAEGELTWIAGEIGVSDGLLRKSLLLQQREQRALDGECGADAFPGQAGRRSE